MRSQIIFSLALGLSMGVCTMARGQRSERPEKVDQALKERYGADIQTEIYGQPTEVNGVKLYNVRIRSDGELSSAVVTEHGDFVRSGTPAQFKQLPKNVQGVRALFKTEPQNAQTFLADGYYIDVEQGGKTYRLFYDPVGRLRDIESPKEVDRYETTTFKKAGDDVSERIRKFSDKQIPKGAEFRDVYIDPRYEGFYVAKYQAKPGEVLVIVDEQGNVYQTRSEIPRDQLPPPVSDAFGRMFEEKNLRFAYRTQYPFYQFQQPTGEGDLVTFRIRPTGDIMDLSSSKIAQEDEAMTARFREGAADTKVGPRPTDRDR